MEFKVKKKVTGLTVMLLPAEGLPKLRLFGRGVLKVVVSENEPCYDKLEKSERSSVTKNSPERIQEHRPQKIIRRKI